MAGLGHRAQAKPRAGVCRRETLRCRGYSSGDRFTTSPLGVRVQTTCERCGKEFRTYPSRLKRGEDRFCSRECGNAARGRAREDNPNWRGGRFVRSDGYVSVRVDGRDVLEHRHVMAGVLGRALRPDEHVHHLNHDRSDNRPENLVVLDVVAHGHEHAGQPDPSTHVWLDCFGCGQPVRRYRSQVARNPRAFCSRDCYRKHAHLTPGRGRQ